LLQSTSPSSTLDGAGPQQHDAFGMARKLRIQYPGAIYHVMNRGDRRQPIFLGDEARRLFLSTLGEACDEGRRRL
jgi:hypothetical protein